MTTYINKLLEISSSSLSSRKVMMHELFELGTSERVDELHSILNRSNGFYTFEGAFHLYSLESIDNTLGLVDWNRNDLWINDYNGLTQGALFFAQDIFGNQFSLLNNNIHLFNIETGQFEFLAKDFDSFCKLLLTDFNFLTGYSFANSWQVIHGKLPNGKRLSPKIPFVLGGQYDMNNLFLADSVNLMKTNGNIAAQIQNIQDGTKINLSFNHI
ncbi:SMI1/KNR4 family protein [Thorsellia kenyensis]|uniref:SMI1/KNR4 family protein n=1 Tax=Thorsellia kenyensis TaxID=1549888 RepID=A0ABV6CDE8_9GAMM